VECLRDADWASARAARFSRACVEQLADALLHNVPLVSPPAHALHHRYPLPRVQFRLDDEPVFWIGDEQGDFALKEVLGEGEADLEPIAGSAPAHACRYCGQHNPATVVQCNQCNYWFCNGHGKGKGNSHILFHLAFTRHDQINLHPQGLTGVTLLKCAKCHAKNVFKLGHFEGDQTILCEMPCSLQKGRTPEYGHF